MSAERISEIIKGIETTKFNWLLKKIALEGQIPLKSSSEDVFSLKTSIEECEREILRCEGELKKYTAPAKSSDEASERTTISNEPLDDAKLIKLFEVYSQAENKLDENTPKDQVADIEAMMRALTERFQDQYFDRISRSPNLKEHSKNILFEQILTAVKLDKALILKIENIRNDREVYHWYDRAPLVAALTLSLLRHKEFDVRKAIFICDFVSDFEEGVWQRALTGLVLALIYRINKWQKYSDLKKKINTLQNIEEFQNALDIIEFILRNKLYTTSLFSGKIYENDFFLKNIANSFLPFYEGNKILAETIENAPNDFNVEEFKDNVVGSPLLDSVKYFMCLTCDYQIKDNDLSPYENFQILNKLGIANGLNPFYNHISEYYNFLKYFPASEVENIFKEQISIANSNKLNSLILGKVLQLKIQAELLKNNEDFKGAISVIKDLLRIEPDHWAALHMIADCYEVLEKYEDALPYRLKIEEKYPHDTNNIVSIGVCYLELEEIDKSFDYHEKVRAAKPTHIKNLLSLARCYLEVDKTKDCVAILDQVASYRIITPDNYYHLSAVYSDANEFAKAIIFLLKAIELRPKYYAYYYSIVSDFLYEGRFKEAIAYNDDGNKLSEGKGKEEYIHNVGLINLIAHGDLPKAKLYLSKLVRRSKKVYTVFGNLGHIEYLTGEKEKANEYYYKCLELVKNIEEFRRRFEMDQKLFESRGVPLDEFNLLKNALVEYWHKTIKPKLKRRKSGAN